MAAGQGSLQPLPECRLEGCCQVPGATPVLGVGQAGLRPHCCGRAGPKLAPLCPDQFQEEKSCGHACECAHRHAHTPTLTRTPQGAPFTGVSPTPAQLQLPSPAEGLGQGTGPHAATTPSSAHQPSTRAWDRNEPVARVVPALGDELTSKEGHGRICCGCPEVGRPQEEACFPGAGPAGPQQRCLREPVAARPRGAGPSTQQCPATVSLCGHHGSGLHFPNGAGVCSGQLSQDSRPVPRVQCGSSSPDHGRRAGPLNRATSTAPGVCGRLVTLVNCSLGPCKCVHVCCVCVCTQCARDLSPLGIGLEKGEARAGQPPCHSATLLVRAQPGVPAGAAALPEQLQDSASFEGDTAHKKKRREQRRPSLGRAELPQVFGHYRVD